jgi:hypothetical protein
MAKVKYDVSNVEDVSGQHAPVGVYVAEVENVDGPKPSKNGNQMLEVRFTLVKDAAGKKVDSGLMPVWYYPLIDHDLPFVQARWKEFLLAFGLKEKGTLDTDKLVGQSVQVRLKADTDLDGEYRPSISKVMKLAAADEPDEAEEEEGEEEEGDEEVDLDSLNRTELKKLIKEEELDIKVVKSMSDDDLREAIADAWGEEEEGEEEEEEEDEEEEGEEDEADGYDEMSIADLKAELKERELPTNGAKKILVGRLRADDGEEAF